MALEALAGPNIVTHLGVIRNAAAHRCFYLDNIGICGFFRGLGGFGAVEAYLYQIAQYDGIVYARNNDVSAFKAGSLSYDFQTGNLLIHNSNTIGLSILDPYTGARGDTLLNFQTVGLWTRYRDRYWRAHGGVLREAPLTATNNSQFTDEYIFPVPSGRNIPAVESPISDYGGNLVAIGFQNGDIWIYDPVNRVHVGEWKTINMDNQGIWYSRRFNVWVSLHKITTGPINTQDEIRVWANETRPATLSNPTALQAVTRGKVSDIRVQLLGASAEPVNGQLVEFSILSGPGQLLNLQANTDVNGYAIARYAVPTTGGNVQIQALTKF
ncbi:MAG: hypothetical protein ACREK4_00100 [Candidatus Rokuibacteriota bacterium]